MSIFCLFQIDSHRKWICRADGGLAPTEGNDDGIVGGPRTPQQIAAQKRLQQTQAQVDEVSKWTIRPTHTTNKYFLSFTWTSAASIFSISIIFVLLVSPETQVVDIMKTNVEKVLERDQKLSELDDRADALQQGASQFEQQAGKLKRKFWLQNLKVNSITRRLK